MSRRVRLTCQSLEDRTTPAYVLDPSFGGGDGLATTRVNPVEVGRLGSIQSVLAQPDGKILATAHYDDYSIERFAAPPFEPLLDWNRVYRFNSDGTPDLTFGTGGWVGFADGEDTNQAIPAIRLAPDGKIYVVVTEGNDAAVHRLNPDGSPDLAFGTAGVVSFPAAGPDESLPAGAELAVQADGRIVLASARSVYVIGEYGMVLDVAAVRLTSDGSPDPTFGPDGVFRYRYVRPGGFVHGGSLTGLTTGPNGNLYVNGGVSTFYRTDPATGKFGSESTNWVLAITPAGVLDPAFAGDGILASGEGGMPQTFGVAGLQPDGKLLLLARPEWPAVEAVIRLNPDGSLDTGFGDGGWSAAPARDRYATIGGLLPDGRIVLVGEGESGWHPRVVLTILGMDGRPTGEELSTSGLAPEEWSAVRGGGVAVTADGRIVAVCGVESAPFNPSYYIGLAAFADLPDEPQTVVDPVDPLMVVDPAADSPELQTVGPTSVPPAAAGLTASSVAAGQPPVVTVYNPDGTVRFTLNVFELVFIGGVSVVLADVNGDGVEDVIASAGEGGGPRIRVFDGSTGAVLADFFAFDDALRVGVTVAVLPDGTIVAGATDGGGPRVRMFTGTGTPLADFFAYEETYRGRVSLAVGDINGDGVADIVTGVGPGGGPHVRAFDGATGAVAADFLAGDPDDRGGVEVAVRPFGAGGANVVVTRTAAGVQAFDPLTEADLTERIDPAALAGVFVG